jgi:glycosyltransferase involved in cell wall biosynthesis
MEEIPNSVRVFRTRCFDTKKHFSFKGKYLQLLALPDRYISWFPFAFRTGLELLKREKIDVLFSTTPYPTAHLIALALKKMRRIPWVADFRDQLVDFESNDGDLSARSYIENRFEKKVVVCSDKVTLTTDWMKEKYIERFPCIDPNKFKVIYNGFDEEDFRGIEPIQKKNTDKFELIHVGSLDGYHRNPESLLIAMSELFREHSELRDCLVLTFVGGSPYFCSLKFTSLLKDIGVAENVKIIPQVSRKESLRYLFKADVLLLLQQSKVFTTLIPAKAFDYLMVGKPILTIASEGATADLIRRKLNAGVVISPEDVGGIKKAILSLYKDFKEGHIRLETDTSKLMEFSRRKLTKTLANTLDSVIPSTTSLSR